MDMERHWEPVARAYVDWLNGVIRERLTTFRDALDVWLNGILAGPIPDDWRERLDQFEQEMATYGIGIRPHSIDALARLIESRARGAGQPASQQRRVRSTIAADGAFVQSVIPKVGDPSDGLGALAELDTPEVYRNARRQEMQPVRTYDERRDVINGKPVLFFRREPGGDWFTDGDKKTEVFRNGRSIGLRQDYSGARKVIAPVAFGLGMPVDPGWAVIFRRIARDLLPVDPEKFIERVLETGEFWRPLAEFVAEDLKAILMAELGGAVVGKAAEALSRQVDRLVARLMRGARLKKAAAAAKVPAPKPPVTSNVVPAQRAPEPAPRQDVRSNLGATKPAAPSNVRWIEDTPHMGPNARAYEDAASGAKSRVASQRRQVPVLDRTLPNGTKAHVKFDGIEGSVLIDRKTAVTTFRKSKDQALHQSQALRENGYTGRWEVPSAREAERARKMLRELEINNINVEVIP